MEYKIGSCFLGRTLELTDGKIEVGVTLDVGPRIIKLNKIGSESIMYEDIAESVTRDVSEEYGEGKMWRIFGGHRIWLSPEDNTTYYPDCTPVEYEITASGAVFTPKAWTERGVAPSLEIVLRGNGELDVIMRMKNISGETRRLCVWALTVLKVGSVVTVPLSTEDTGFLANRNIVLWHYNDIHDSRFTLENDKFILRGTPEAEGPFKVGTWLKHVKAEYRYKDTVLIKETEGLPGDAPDFTCNMETYTNRYIHEVETLSPIRDIADGETLVHIEKWTVR